MKIAIVHDYLHTYGGGEKVLELFHELYPEADIYTLVYIPSTMPDAYRTWNISTSFLNKVPMKKRFVKYLTPLMPLAIESFDFSDYDLVLSISAGFAKGCITGAQTCHISYTLTVPRFLWGYETSTQVKHRRHILLPFVNNYLRIWDRSAADRVDAFLANSQTVKNRIAKSYGRDATVIYSPVDEERFNVSTIKREDYYLVVSRLEPYKRIDLAIKACQQTKTKLYIIGEGSARRELENMASDTITFLGYADDETVMRHYKTAKAVIFPGADDLGLVPIEAQMCGTPVIAYKRDGVLETVIDGVSGVLFEEQSMESLVSAMKRLDTLTLSAESIRAKAMQFSKSSIKEKLQKTIADMYGNYTSTYKK